MRLVMRRRPAPNQGTRPRSALALGLLLLGAACAEPPPPPAPPPPRAVDVLVLQPTEVRETAEYLGSLLSRQNISVLPQVAGYVRRIHVRPGQSVQAGALLVEIDAREGTAALESAQAQQRSAQANLELAQQTAARTRSLFAEGLVSAQEWERAQSQEKASDAALKAAEAAVAQRRVQLQFFDVKAPFSGVIGEVRVKVGDFVTATTPLTSLAQSKMLEVSVAVPAERARQIQPGTPLELLSDSGELLVTAPVFYIAPEANSRTQLVDVKAVFENQAHLRPSEYVRARIVYSTRQALEVPALAVVRQSGQAFVYGVTEEGTVERRPITLGALGPRNYVVEGGLSSGDQIAVSSIQALRDGAPIQANVLSASAQAEAAPTAN